VPLMVRPLHRIRRVTHRVRHRLKFWWDCLVADRLFALREWLADGPDKVDRRWRPMLSILPLESRQMPSAFLATYDGPGIMSTVDDHVTHFGANSSYLLDLGYLLGTAGTYDVNIDWGDGTSSVAPVTISSFQNYAYIAADHDYHGPGQAVVPDGFHTITVSYGGNSFDIPINIYEGQNLTVSGSTVTEDAGHATFTVTMTGFAPTRDITVDYQTHDGTDDSDKATAGKNYKSTSGTLTIPAGTTDGTNFTINVPVIDDRIVDKADTEYFTVDFSNPVATNFGDHYDFEGIDHPDMTAQANIGIENVDVAHVRFRSGLYSVAEPAADDSATYNLRVDLDIPVERSFTVGYATHDPYAPYVPPTYQTALADTDYESATGALTFTYNGTLGRAPLTQYIPVTIYGNDVLDPNRYFGVNLFGSSDDYVDVGNYVPPGSAIKKRDTADVRIVDSIVLSYWYALAKSSGMDNPQLYPGSSLPLLYDPRTGLFLDPTSGILYNPKTGSVRVPVSLNPCGVGATCGRNVDVAASVAALVAAGVDLTGAADTQQASTTPGNSATTTVNQASLGFTYNSSTVDSRPVVGVVLPTNPSNGVPTSIDATLTFNGTTFSTVTFSTTGHAAGDTYSLSLQVPSGYAITTSGIYDWTVDVTAHFSGSSDLSLTVDGTTGAVAGGGPFGCAPYGIASVFLRGMGWGIDLLENKRTPRSTRARRMAMRSTARSVMIGSGPKGGRTSSRRAVHRWSSTNSPNDTRSLNEMEARAAQVSSGVGPLRPRGRAVALASSRAAATSSQVQQPGRPWRAA
jgi:hypothetical protein